MFSRNRVAYGAVLFVFGVVLAGCSASDADPEAAALPITTLSDGELTACLYSGFAPFSSIDENGEWIGWDVDYLADFAAAHGLQLKPVDQGSFDGIWQKPGQDICDVSGSGIGDTQERQDASPKTDWSNHYYTVTRAFAVRAGKADSLKDVTDLAKKTVIVTRASAADLDLEQQILQKDVPNVTVEYTEDEVGAAQAVIDGDAFAYGGGLGSIEYLVSQFPGQLVVAWEHQILEPDGTNGNESFSFVMREDSAGLTDALNSYIDSHRDSYGTSGE